MKATITFNQETKTLDLTKEELEKFGFKFTTTSRNIPEGAKYLKDIPKFSLNSNRFELFNKDEKKINIYAVYDDYSRQDIISKIPILEMQPSYYTSNIYFVAFDTLHIKLDLEGYASDSSLEFGAPEVVNR